MSKDFNDGIASVVNELANERSAPATNQFVASRISRVEQRAMFRSGIGSKIVRLKSSYSLNDTLQFEKTLDEKFYNAHLAKHVKKAVRFMLGFGRGIILLNERGADLATPARNVSISNIKLDVFSGDMITAMDVVRDLSSDRYMKPLFYVVRGKPFHYTRVIDFTYVEPAEEDLPHYDYGGVSEFELIRAQLINDGVVERASATIIDKNSTVFHKITGWKEALETGQEEFIVKYMRQLAKLRSIYGDGIMDANDDVVTVTQALSNLAEVDQISLRRLAMVTGIPLALLVGENVKGLNSTGDNERASFQDMIEGLQSEYLQDPISQLCAEYGIMNVEFKENQGGTPETRIDFETKAIQNALLLAQMGEDHIAYLKEYGLSKGNEPTKLWGFGDNEAED